MLNYLVYNNVALFCHSEVFLCILQIIIQITLNTEKLKALELFLRAYE